MPQLQAQGMWPSGQGDDKQRFLADLRALRDGAAMGYDELAARTHYPDDVLKEAEIGPSLPGLPVLAAFVRACDGDVPEWEERWRRLGFDADADPGLPVRPAGASPAAVAGARASVSVAPPDAYDPDRIRAVLRGIHHTEQETGATAVASRPQEFAGGWGSGPGQDPGWGETTAAPAQPEAAEDTVRLQSGWEGGYQVDGRAGVSYQAEEQTVLLPDGRAGYQAEEQTAFLPGSRAGYQPDERSIFQPEERAAWQPDERSAFPAEERAGFEVDERATVQPGEPSGFRADEASGFQTGEASGFQAGGAELGGASAGGSPWRGEPAGLPAVNSPDEMRAEAIRRDPFSSEWLQDGDLAARPGAEGWAGRPAAEPSADSWFARPGTNPRGVSHTSGEDAATESWFAPRDLSGSGLASQAGPEAGPAPSLAPDERGGTSFRPAGDEPAIPGTSWSGGPETSSTGSSSASSSSASSSSASSSSASSSSASSSPAGVQPAGASPNGAGASLAGASPAWAGQPGPAGADITGTTVRPEPVSGPEVARTPPSAPTGPSGPGEPARVRRSDRLSLVWLLVIIVVAALIGSALVLLFR